MGGESWTNWQGLSDGIFKKRGIQFESSVRLLLLLSELLIAAAFIMTSVVYSVSVAECMCFTVLEPARL